MKRDWPVLPPLAAWEDSRATLHLWSQIVGKIRLGLSPWINHSWGSALYVTSRGLTTSPMPGPGGSFTVDFDFVEHVLRVEASDGRGRRVALRPMSVAAFHAELFEQLGSLGIRVEILGRPVEVEEAIPFALDETHASYDAEAVHLFWRALVEADRVFKVFRAGFAGKASPVHFFWGAFDLATTRFSGRPAPRHPGGAPNVADWVMVEAYSHELASAGFWPGNGFGEAAFYAYAYPEPEGFRAHPVEPADACFHEALGEFILPYEAVRAASDPDAALLAFLSSTYGAAADLARWDRRDLELDASRRS